MLGIASDDSTKREMLWRLEVRDVDECQVSNLFTEYSQTIRSASQDQAVSAFQRFDVSRLRFKEVDPAKKYSREL
jgi:hypothetical protein